MVKRLLVLRPQPGAARTAARARAAGFDAAIYPLFDVVPLAWTPPDPARFDALLVTSANAPRHAGQALAAYRDLPAFAVGAATAAALRAAGFFDISTAHGDVAAALALARADGRAQLLHLSGRHVAGRADPLVTRLPVYDSCDTGDAAGLAARLVPGMTVAVHSSRAAARLADLLPLDRRETLDLIAISPAALAAAGTGWNSARAAPTPDDEAMLALAHSLCD